MSPSNSDPTSAQYKRDHPERAREYNRRANAKRPDRPRDRMKVCRVCGEIAPHTHKATRCRRCIAEGRDVA